jgi:[acyl-carrier-protein] S-malonyltransferase
MSKATEVMQEELSKLKFKKGTNPLISNITADEIFNAEELKDLLVKQIENRVRWRESVINMVNKGVNQFIEIGPGKVLLGLVKRINKEVLVSSINSEEEIKNIKI